MKHDEIKAIDTLVLFPSCERAALRSSAGTGQFYNPRCGSHAPLPKASEYACSYIMKCCGIGANTARLMACSSRLRHFHRHDRRGVAARNPETMAAMQALFNIAVSAIPPSRVPVEVPASPLREENHGLSHERLRQRRAPVAGEGKALLGGREKCLRLSLSGAQSIGFRRSRRGWRLASVWLAA